MLFARLLDRLIRQGSLIVVDAANRDHRFGDASTPAVTLRLHDRALHWQLFFNPGLYFGEAYMDGRLSIDGGDIYRFLALVGQNIRASGGGWNAMPNSGFARVSSRLGYLLRRFLQANDHRRARRHAAHHYELDERLYDLFLDSNRIYSCAYFMTPDDSLERAQQQKCRHLAAKLRLRAGQRVLDIGCGWGGLAVYLAEAADVNVVGINVAEAQVAAARVRAAKQGLNERVTFEVCDYRDAVGTYDRIVSVGFLEHVGVPNFEAFFRRVRACLTEDGVALIHFIGRPDGPGTTNPWMRKYIFPGGYSPALSEVVAAIERSGLWITDIEFWRMHYAWTLRCWRDRFLSQWETARALYDERFCRMWEFYLAACEATFRFTPHGVFQVQLTRRIDALPYTRDYMYDAEQLLPLTSETPAPRRWHPYRELT